MSIIIFRFIVQPKCSVEVELEEFWVVNFILKSYPIRIHKLEHKSIYFLWIVFYGFLNNKLYLLRRKERRFITIINNIFSCVSQNLFFRKHFWMLTTYQVPFNFKRFSKFYLINFFLTWRNIFIVGIVLVQLRYRFIFLLNAYDY